MRRLLTVLTLVVGLVLGAAPATAHHTPRPELGYTGAEHIWNDGWSYGNTGGLVFQRGGRYYMATVDHVTGPLGTGIATGERHLGVVAYKNRTKDIALIDLGTTRPSPRLRISPTTVRTISGWPLGPDWPQGATLCTSGHTFNSTVLNKCGWADYSAWTPAHCQTSLCNIKAHAGQGAIAASTDAGASGSVVYRPQPDGTVVVVGMMSKCFVTASYCPSAGFRGIWLWARHCWTAEETLSGYPTGCGTDGFGAWLLTGV